MEGAGAPIVPMNSGSQPPVNIKTNYPNSLIKKRKNVKKILINKDNIKSYKG